MDKEKEDKRVPLTGKIGQIARILREEAKQAGSLKERETFVLKKSEHLSVSNAVEQIAKFLRSHIHEVRKEDKPSKTPRKKSKKNKL